MPHSQPLSKFRLLQKVIDDEVVETEQAGKTGEDEQSLKTVKVEKECNYGHIWFYWQRYVCEHVAFIRVTPCHRNHTHMHTHSLTHP